MIRSKILERELLLGDTRSVVVLGLGKNVVNLVSEDTAYRASEDG